MRCISGNRQDLAGSIESNGLGPVGGTSNPAGVALVEPMPFAHLAKAEYSGRL